MVESRGRQLRLDAALRGPDEVRIERRWLARARLEPDDFEFFVTKYEHRIFRHLALLFGDPDLAAELTHETFVRAYEHVERFQFRGLTIGGWLYRIATNLARRHANRRRRRQERETQVDGDAPGERLGPADELGGHQLAVLLHEELLELRPEYRHVLALRYWEDLCTAEIALVLDAKRETVKSWLRRAREELAVRLAARGVRVETNEDLLVLELDPGAEFVQPRRLRSLPEGI